MKRATVIKNKIVRLYIDLPLRKKLLMVFGTIIVLQVFGGILFNVVFTKNVFSDMFTSYSNSMLDNIGSNIRIHMSNAENISQNILYNERIYNIICSNTNNHDTLKLYDERSEVDELLKNISYPQQEVEAIYLYNQNGVCYSMDSYNTFDEAVILSEFTDDSETPVWKCIDDKIYMGRTIYSKNTFEKIGFQILKLKNNVFINEFTNLNKFISLEIINDNFDYMYSYRDKTIPAVSKENFEKFIIGKNGSYVDKKNDCVVFFSRLDEYNWNLVAMMPLSELYRNINRVRDAVLVFGIFVCLLMLVLALIFCKDLLNPIQSLIYAIKDFEQTNTISTVSTEREDEIGFLMVKYNDLVRHIDMLVNTVYKEQISRRNAQIKSLQAQLNPHFIYNTLEIINWKAQFHGADDVSDMIYHLASLIDAGLGKGKRFVTLEKELEYTDHYCRITKVRFGNSIEFRFDIEEDSKKVEVPVLILQPLVENSVLHGTGKVGRKGIVLIKTYLEDKCLVIEITDNGIGIEEEKLKELKSRLESGYEQFTLKDGYGELKNGIGILNANERIRLNYGDEYGIKIQSSYRHYCKIRCVLPVEKDF